jgi:hypothetical protein
MKRNAKKLAVFLIVAALSIFMAVATASAGSKFIKGHYALSGFTSCSVGGSPAGPGVMEADYTFNKNGTGSATGWIRQITDPSVAPEVLYITLHFTYKVKEGRIIEFAYPEYGFKVYAYDEETETCTYLLQWDAAMSHGVISPDGETMTITCGPPKKLHMVEALQVEAVCVTSLAGMRVHDKERD